LSFPFLLLLNNTGGSLLATWRIDPWALVGGAAAGVVTAVIFGLVASVQASAVRPAALLRNQVDPPRRTRAATAGVWLVLGLVFAVLSSVILGSPVLGAGVLLVAVGGLLGLGGVLGSALALVMRVPVRAHSVVALAQHNLRRQGLRSVFALIALWTGVFAIGFAMATVGRASGRVTARSVDTGGDNLVVYARAADTAAVLQQLEQQHVQQVRTQLLAGITTARADGTPLPISQLGGAAALGVDMVVEDGAAWGTHGGVYIQPTMIDSMLAEGQSLAIGDEITLRGANGTRTLPIVGTITYPGSYAIQVPLPALVAPDVVVRELGGERVTVYMIGHAPPNSLREVDLALNAALPQALAITDVSFNDSLTRAVYNQFLFVVAIAGLALLAGAVLIANTVGLALVERRRELGILKAVGYNSGQVLRTILLEHSVLGVISGVAGIMSVWLAIALANRQEIGLELALGPLPALAIVAVAVGLAGSSALVVAWRPTHVRPLAVLRDA
jgi:putative ABC transport system permease protein